MVGPFYELFRQDNAVEEGYWDDQSSYRLTCPDRRPGVEPCVLTILELFEGWLKRG